MTRADFCITKTHYNSEHDLIIEVEARQMIGDLLAHPQRMPREKVVELIKSSLEFVTGKALLKDRWSRGEDVRLVTVEGVEYLRADTFHDRKDDLGEMGKK